MSSIDNEPMNSSGAPNPGQPPLPASRQDLGNPFVNRLKRDKILLALIIVGILTIFVGVAFTGDEQKTHEPPLHGQQQQMQSPGQMPMQQGAAPMQQGGLPAQAPGQPGAPTGFTPQMATQFITVWLQRSMDYNMQTCQTSHKEAFDWMTPNTVQAFRQGYWTPDIEQAVVTGKVTAAFQPISVQATYMNPDGSIIVAMTGSLVMQSAGTSPATQPLAADFLVKQDNGNVRVVGINIHPSAQTGSPY